MKSAFAAAAACGLLLSGTIEAAEIKVLSSNAAKEAYTELFPQFEKASGHKIVITWAGTNDISSAEALKKTLIAAKSVGYSQGPSGVYMAGLFEKMGIADAVKAKAKVVTPGIPVATVVRNGEAEIGFQQVSELIHEKGIDFLGPLPAEIQRITIFSGGIHTQAKEPAAAKALQSFLTAPERAPDLKKHGLSPG
jgi:molybdate transport system substrate-binding protein